MKQNMKLSINQIIPGISKGKILIISRKNPDSLSLSKYLQTEHYNVILIQESPDIYKEIKKNAPDLILLNFLEEKEKDFHTLRSVKADESRELLPVMLFSNAEDLLERLRVFEEGADDLIFNPSFQVDFLWKIEILIHLRSLTSIFNSNEQIFATLENNEFTQKNALKNKEKVQEYLKKNLSLLTENKISLHFNKEELDIFCKGEVVITQNILSKDDVKRAKELLLYFSKDPSISKVKWNGIITSISEALSNVIKYAGCGTLTVMKFTDTINVRIDDDGKGIPYKDLLRSIFIKKFSRQRIHKLGFPLMIELTDKLLLYTGPDGTSLILQFKL